MCHWMLRFDGSPSASPSSFTLKRHGNRINLFSRRFLEAFIPEGFPSSVTPDYIPFQTPFIQSRTESINKIMSGAGAIVGEKGSSTTKTQPIFSNPFGVGLLWSSQILASIIAVRLLLILIRQSIMSFRTAVYVDF